MISLQDCIAICGLDESEVRAIAEHEHVPEMVAAAMAQYMMRQAHGPETVLKYIVDDVRAANERGDQQHVRELLMCMKHFLHEHPEAVPASPSETA
jgi:hypothetical protein